MTKERRLLLTLAAIQFTHIMDFMIMMPLGPQLMRVFHIAPAKFGMLVSAYTFSAGMTGFLAIFLLDRFDRRKALLACYAGLVTGTLGCALAPTWEFLLAARIVAGGFGGVLGALVLSIVGDAIPSERRGAAMGIVMGAFSVASVAGVPVGLLLASLFSWHAPFLLLVACGSALLVLIPRWVPEMKGHLVSGDGERVPVAKGLAPFFDLVRLAEVRWALTLTVLLVFSGFTVIPFLAPSLVTNAGFSEKQLSLVYLFGGGFTFFTSPWIGRLSDRVGRIPLFAGLSLLAPFPVFFITRLEPVGIAWVLLLTSCFFIFMNGRFVVATTLLSGVVPASRRGAFMSLQSSVQQIASSLAAFASGIILVKSAGGRLEHYATVGWISIACSLLALAVAFRIRSKN